MAELDDLRDHLERFRTVTFQSLDLLTDEELGWRPGPDHMTLGQLFLHIAQSEDFQVHAHIHGEWDWDRVRSPAKEPNVQELRSLLRETRDRTLAALNELDQGRLDDPVGQGAGQPTRTLRWWLWLLVEHEVHHKAQISVYLRQMGKTPPYFAEALENGARPDIEAREKLGGF